MKLNKLSNWFVRQTKLIATVMVAAIVGGTTTAAVLAAVPDSNGVIHSCYKTGLLNSFKIIDTPSQSCAVGQTELTWDQTSKSSVVYRGRASNVSVPEQTSALANFSPGSWTQAASETDQLLAGTTVTITQSGSEVCIVGVDIVDPVQSITYASTSFTAGSGTYTANLTPVVERSFMLEPGVSTPHTLKAQLSNATADCGLVVNSVALDVIGTR